MRKLVAVILIIVAVLITNVAQFFIQLNHHNKLTERLDGEIATLESTIDAIGPVVECYTVRATTRPGQEIKEEDLVLQSIPQSFINDSYVLDKTQLIGKFFKISLNPGTPLTSDCVMDDSLDDTMRDVDLLINQWTVGLKVGNYVDVRFRINTGEDFIVLSHKRVYEVGDKTFKIYLTEGEIHRYLSAMVDAESFNVGSLWVTRYVEPGTQAAATPYYPVRPGVEAIMLVDPNVKDKTVAKISKDLRYYVDNAIAGYMATYNKRSVDPVSVWQSVATSIMADYGMASAMEGYVNDEVDYGWSTPDTGGEELLGDGVIE